MTVEHTGASRFPEKREGEWVVVLTTNVPCTPDDAHAKLVVALLP